MDRIEILKENLEKKGYLVKVFEKGTEAAEYLNSNIDGKTVGIGGSVTVKEIGLYPILKTHNEVYWHDDKPEGLTDRETREKANLSEIYISSVNGVSLDGQIVNIDNTGNRVAAITFGPKMVYLVFGENKVEDTLEKAWFRARNIAGPLNAIRLKKNTPCAVKGDKCYDCKSPERICRNFQVLPTKPTGVKVEVLIVKEKLGY